MAKALALVGAEPAVKFQPARPVMVSDSLGRNITKWLPQVDAKPEGPVGVCIAINEGTARVYLTVDEASDLANAIAICVETLNPPCGAV
jgi:hypothetical protein